MTGRLERRESSVEIRIYGEPKEIAALVLELQGRQHEVSLPVIEEVTDALERKLRFGTPEA